MSGGGGGGVALRSWGGTLPIPHEFMVGAAAGIDLGWARAPRGEGGAGGTCVSLKTGIQDRDIQKVADMQDARPKTSRVLL